MKSIYAMWYGIERCKGDAFLLGASSIIFLINIKIIVWWRLLQVKLSMIDVIFWIHGILWMLRVKTNLMCKNSSIRSKYNLLKLLGNPCVTIILTWLVFVYINACKKDSMYSTCSTSYLLKQHLQHCLLVLLFPFDEFGCSCYGHHQKVATWLLVKLHNGDSWIIIF